jgi:hypothetical protein
MKRGRSNSALLFTLVLLIVVMLPMGAACEPDVPLEIDNQTDMTLTIYLKDNEKGTVGPKSTEKIKGITGTLGEWQIVAKNSQGEVVFSKIFTPTELHELDYKVVIPPPSQIK